MTTNDRNWAASQPTNRPTDEYERLVDTTRGHAVFMLTHEGHIDSWPDTAREIYGYDADGIVGMHLRALYVPSEEMAAEVDDSLETARERATEHEAWHQRLDGSVFWATCTLSPVHNGSFHGYTAVVQNTTSQRQYIRMLERQNDRLKEFTGILSHDMRNPLAIVDGRMDLYRETGDDEHLDVVERTVERMEVLIDDLLRIARNGSVVEDPEPTDIRSLVLLAGEAALSDTATLTYDHVPRLMAEEKRLHELFENLLRNAAEHGGPDVHVRVGPLHDGFFVEDDGPGIPEEIREEVFDHGFTTAEDGSGFGLSLVRTIVGAHGWDVTVTESDAGGARFEVTGIDFVE
jgi:PAS domain S-box-containing protein